MSNRGKAASIGLKKQGAGAVPEKLVTSTKMKKGASVANGGKRRNHTVVAAEPVPRKSELGGPGMARLAVKGNAKRVAKAGISDVEEAGKTFMYGLLLDAADATKFFRKRTVTTRAVLAAAADRGYLAVGFHQSSKLAKRRPKKDVATEHTQGAEQL